MIQRGKISEEELDLERFINNNYKFKEKIGSRDLKNRMISDFLYKTLFILFSHLNNEFIINF